MNQCATPAATYQELIVQSERTLTQVKQQIYRASTMRVLLFLGGAGSLIYCWSESALLLCGITLVTLVPFLALVRLHARLFTRRAYLEQLIAVNQQELRAMEHDTAAFDGGNEFIDPSHPYSYDLDLFGQRSLFQYINRTSTVLGKERLARWFSAHLESREAIEVRQEAIQELAPELQFRQAFRVSGLLYRGEPADESEINRWASSSSHYRSRLVLRLLPVVACFVNLLLLGLALAGRCPSALPGLVFVGFVLASFLFSKGISKIQALYGSKLQILGTYARLIHLLEEKPFRSCALQEVRARVGGERQVASQAVAHLTRLMNALDQRNNVLLATMLNGFFFWELRQIMRIEAWREQYAGELPQWLEAIGEMDAYCSLATFAYNHPDYTYPQLLSHPFRLEARELGHPLMSRTKCVRNDIEIRTRPFFLIVTGANMAGKSTYLRTVGVNYLLACLGAPVWADEMTLYPAKLVTSLRTSDSLNDDESYFFAELKRLKQIIDRLHAREELFIILDEILKGTNSLDKQKGSFALVKQFLTLQTNGIIATHDLLLGTLIQTFPEQIRNHCFEAEIQSDELIFSYRKQEGIAQKMNACFLMNKMGIVGIDA